MQVNAAYQLTLTLTRLGRITGTVTDALSNAPLAGATVSTGSVSTTTDSQGHYTLLDLPAGATTVTAAATGYLQRLRQRHRHQWLHQHASLAVTQAGGISGCVTAGGVALAGATVSTGSATTTTAADGTYSLAPLAIGSDSVSAVAVGYLTQTLTVPITFNNITTVNFALQVDTTPPTISALTPANNTYVGSTQPGISALLSDGLGAGIDPTSIVVTLDGASVTNYLYNATTGLLSDTPATPLALGVHTVTVSVADLGQLSATATWSFTVVNDTQGPTINVTSPAPYADLSQVTPILGSESAQYYPMTYYVEVDPYCNYGTWMPFTTGTLSGPINGQLTTFNATGLANGFYDVRMRVVDACGLEAISQTIPGIEVDGTLKMGGVVRTEVDLSVPWPGKIPFELRRTYNSQNYADVPFAQGWSDDLHPTIDEFMIDQRFDANGAAVGACLVTLSTGQNVYFLPEALGMGTDYYTDSTISYTSDDPSVKATLVRQSTVIDPLDEYGLNYTLTMADGSYDTFTTTMYVEDTDFNSTCTAMSDAAGNTLSITNNGNTITDPTGRAINLERDANNRITHAWYSSPTGDVSRNVYYTYSDTAPEFVVTKTGSQVADENGNLGPRNVVTEYYYNGPAITAVVLPEEAATNNLPVLTTAYDNAGRVALDQVYTALGVSSNITYTYDTNTDLTTVNSANGSCQTVQASSGAVSSLAVTPPDATAPTLTSQMSYGDSANPLAPTTLTTTIDGVTKTTTTSYDAYGDPLTLTVDAGNGQVQQLTLKL